MIVLDTHAWVWWVSAPTELSRAARRSIEDAMAANRVLVSSISAWEVTLLEAKGRLRLLMDVREWIARSEALPFLRFVPVDNRIAISSTRLVGFAHPDPADRIIIATALELEAPLVTRDRRMHSYGPVRTIW